MAFTSLKKPVSSRPRAAMFGPGSGINFIRDQFDIQTWLAIGAAFEGVLFLLIGYYALFPVVLFLGYQMTDTYLVVIKAKENPLMKDVIQGKFSAQIPNELGEFSGKPADSEVVVFLIGTRANHPLGLLAPGFKQLGDYFISMSNDLEKHADEFGMLGMTSWTSASQRTTKNELLTVCYFRNYDGLHRFAHSEYHREGWRWYEKIGRQFPHLGLYHETYSVPAGNWETIYVNHHPSHLASSTFKITDQETGEDRWASPIVDASRGLLKTSKGRMSRSNATENDKYSDGKTLYDIAKAE